MLKVLARCLLFLVDSPLRAWERQVWKKAVTAGLITAAYFPLLRPRFSLRASRASQFGLVHSPLAMLCRLEPDFIEFASIASVPQNKMGV